MGLRKMSAQLECALKSASVLRCVCASHRDGRSLASCTRSAYHASTLYKGSTGVAVMDREIYQELFGKGGERCTRALSFACFTVASSGARKALTVSRQHTCSAFGCSAGQAASLGV